MCSFPIFTIGHSNYALEHFLTLLHDAGIQVVVDVRSQPYSRYCPHFSREPLQRALREAAMQYVFLGEELGGRPQEAAFYDVEGHVLFALVARTAWFTAGLERVERGAQQYHIALLCSEEDPDHCHRHHLVGRALLQRGFKVEHIRGDGRIQAAELPPTKPGTDGQSQQLSLDQLIGSPAASPGEEEEWKSPWKLTPSASPRSRRSSSSER